MNAAVQTDDGSESGESYGIEGNLEVNSGFETEKGCAEIEFAFVRGSGQKLNQSTEWSEFEAQMQAVAKRGNYSYQIVDLPYPAVSVAGFRNLLGAYVSAGKYYKFGKSVRSGVRMLVDYYQETMARCRITKWVLAGYSQGAMVVSEAVKSFMGRDVVFVALFGDPELFLPEGNGLWPKACRGMGLSEYRVYVPACRTRKGSLGRRNPYEYGELAGKYGLWCERKDYICGSSNNPLKNDGHLRYGDFAIAWMSELASERLSKLSSLSSVRNDNLRKKPTRTAPIRLVKGEAKVVAKLPLAEYVAKPGEEVLFNASASYSSDGKKLRYWWNFGDG